MRTLSYFDGVSFARRAAAPALFSVGLMDMVCPPSTVYAAFNASRGGGQEHHRILPLQRPRGRRRAIRWPAQAEFLGRLTARRPRPLTTRRPR